MAHEDLFSAAFLPRYCWQKAPLEVVVQVSPVQQGGCALLPHCCSCTEQLPPVEEPVPLKETF